MTRKGQMPLLERATLASRETAAEAALYQEWLGRYGLDAASLLPQQQQDDGLCDSQSPEAFARASVARESQPQITSWLAVFRRALTHRSADRKASNERLEFLGDAVLQLGVVSYLYERFPDQDEGFMTRMRTRLVNGEMVGTYARHLGMEPWLRVRSGHEGRRQATNVLEDAFEAWLGALYENHGFDAAKRWLVNFIERHVDMADLIVQRRDYKTRLYRYFASVYRCEPAMERVRGAEGHRTTLKDAEGRQVAQGWGATSKQADENACRAALQYYAVS